MAKVLKQGLKCFWAFEKFIGVDYAENKRMSHNKRYESQPLAHQLRATEEHREVHENDLPFDFENHPS